MNELAGVKDWILPIFGILLTAAFGWYPIKKAVGASTERRSRANQEFSELVVRRLVLEDYWPDQITMVRMRAGIAEKYGLDPDTLISNNALHEIATFQIVSNDYIESKRRMELLEKIRSSQDVSQADNLTDEEDAELRVRPRSRPIGAFTHWMEISTALVSLLLGIIASVSLSGAVDFLQHGTISIFSFLAKSFSGLVVPIALGSMALASVATYFLYIRTARTREALDRVSTRTQVDSVEQVFVTRVRIELFRAKIAGFIRQVVSEPPGGADFLIEYNDGTKAAVEAKSAVRPSSNIADWFYQLRRYMERDKATEGILIVQDDLQFPSRLRSRDPNIRVMTLAGLGDFLQSLKAV